MDRTEHGSSMGAKATFASQLDEAAKSERWMAAVWRVQDGRIELRDVTTWHFPTGDFLAAVGQLSARLFDETKAVREALPSTPLPSAFPRISPLPVIRPDGDN